MSLSALKDILFSFYFNSYLEHVLSRFCCDCVFGAVVQQSISMKTIKRLLEKVNFEWKRMGQIFSKGQ